MSRPLPLPTHRAHPGQTLVLFALATTVLLSALGLAIDGGYLYVQRRAMQNAADAAALAGAQAIGQDQTDTVVYQTVLAAAARNGVTDASNVTCRLITNQYPSGTTQDCSTSTTGTAMSALATAFTGVEVRVAERHQTFVMRAVGTPETGTAATAAAQVRIAANIQVGPFVVCAIDTAVYSAPANYKGGGIFQNGPEFPNSGKPKYLRDDGYDNCNGGVCYQTAVSNGAPVFNDAAFAYLDGALTPIKDNKGNNAVGPTFLIHDPSGITDCNDNSSSFKGVNTNTLVVSPPSSGYWNVYSPSDTLSLAPEVTTGNITSVEATVEGLNGCKKGDAFNNCILILPIVDNSGPGGTGSNARLAWRMLGAFYIKEISNGSHTGALIKNYPLTGDSSATWVPGSRAISNITLIK